MVDGGMVMSRAVQVQDCGMPLAIGPPSYHLRMRCPVCGHRAFDLSDPPHEMFWVGLKCPNCHHVVDIPCPRGLLTTE